MTAKQSMMPDKAGWWLLGSTPVEDEGFANLYINWNLGRRFQQYRGPCRRNQMTAEEHIKRYRRDAEKSERDSLVGIKMLRNWLRGLHIDVVIGHDAAQDLTQDDIAKALDEYPRGHRHEFKVRDPRDHIDMSAGYTFGYDWNGPQKR